MAQDPSGSCSTSALQAVTPLGAVLTDMPSASFATSCPSTHTSCFLQGLPSFQRCWAMTT
eukprot:3089685-Prorocentrum_lima.AAC.1